MTPQTTGAAELPQALRPIQRYKIGYATDDWGMRSSSPSGIPDVSGSWVRYADHVAQVDALRNQPIRAHPPTVVHWRNNGIEACAGIADAYGCKDAARDMRAMLTASFAQPAGAATPAAPEALSAAQAGVPAGYVLVPVKATQAMLDELIAVTNATDDPMRGLNAALVLAPQPSPPPAPAQPGQEGEREYEHDRAIMEGERNASLDSYSRVVYLTQAESRIYETAFTNGWNRRAARARLEGKP